MAANYEVIDQQEIMDVDATGVPVRAMSVQFRTKPSGVISSVRIPIKTYSATEVDREASALAAKIEEAHQL